MTDKHVAFIGLGAMGFGMATALLKAQVKVTGFDVDPGREAQFAEESGRPADPAVIGTADVIVLMVVNSDQCDALLFADGRFGPGGLAQQIKPEAVVVNMATVAPSYARAAAERFGVARYLDAPVSGGTARAAAGTLAILASGAPPAFDGALPVVERMASKVHRLGDVAGAGAAMKMVNQLLAGVHIAATAEAMTFGIGQGLDPHQIVEIIGECAGNSWMLQNRGPHIADGDYTPLSAVDIFVKDLGLVSDIARASRFSAPLSTTALDQFLAASGSGLGREDDAAVAKVYARNGGIKLPGDAA